MTFIVVSESAKAARLITRTDHQTASGTLPAVSPNMADLASCDHILLWKLLSQ